MKNSKKSGKEANSQLTTLVVEGTRYKTTLTRKATLRKNWAKPNPKLISSYIPGTIVKVMVKKGQMIREGDSLLVFDAMKMKNLVKSHVNGTVSQIHIAEGQQVPKGVVMIELS